MKKIILSSLLSLSMSTVFAEHLGHDTGKVLDVEPIYQRVQVSYPERECWTETSRHQSNSHYNNHSNTGTVVGGIIGGLLGQNVGKGRGRDAAIVAGSLLGMAVASDHQRPSRPYYYDREEQRCETHHHASYERRIVGYNVHYEYNNQDYWTTTRTRPGRYISLNIRVDADEYGHGSNYSYDNGDGYGYDEDYDYNRFDRYDNRHEMTDDDYYD